MNIAFEADLVYNITNVENKAPQNFRRCVFGFDGDESTAGFDISVSDKGL